MSLLMLIMMLALGADAQADATVTLVTGETSTGVVVQWDDQKLQLTAAGESRDLPTSELLNVHWRDVALAADARFIELVDGTRLAYADFTLADRVATVASPVWSKPLTIPTKAIRRVEMQPASEAIAAVWRDLESKELAGDVLIISKRDGTSLDYLAGVLGNVTKEQADFEWDGEKVAVKLSKIAAIGFYLAKAATLPEARCKLRTVDGSEIVCREVELGSDALSAVTLAGVTLEVPLEQLASADFSTGKLVYLSDLQPSESKWTPRIAAPAGARLLGAYGNPRNNQSFAGSALSLLWNDDPLPDRRDLRTYAKGLALRSRTELTYRVPADMRRFQGIAGIDPATAAQGHVTLEILGDGNSLWQGEIDGQRPPVEIDVELGSARRLQIRVDYGENLDYGDRLHLVEARVTK